MLLCCICHQWKPEADFPLRSKKTGKRQSHCRKCHAKYRRQHYLDNRAGYIRREADRIKSNRIANRTHLRQYLLDHPCVDCGETDPVLLEFDHLDPSTKSFDVGFALARKPWHLVLEEIAKCVVRCVACHRKRTAMQFNWRSASPVPPTIRPAVQMRLPSTETRVCTSCQRLLATSEFGVRNKATGRLNRRCRQCVSAASREHYRKNRETYLARNRKRDRSASQKPSLRLEYLSSHPCVDCGETDPMLLEFDHRKGELKIGAVAQLIWDRKWALVRDEIAKCVVRCVRCHRRKTAHEFGWSKLAESPTMYAYAGVL